jgi:predicted acylesterase/phospholipase RssA
VECCVKNIKVGLVLSGGGARGLAHLGVLSVLEEHGVVVDLVVGASFGSIVAGYYGMGYSVGDMRKKAEEFEMMTTQQDTRLLHAFVAGQKAEEFFRRDFGDTRIEELRLPVFILAADLTSSEMYVFREGPIVPAMRASSSFPGLFEPLLWKGHRYMDGGVLNSMMLKVAKDSGADLIIYSDVSVFGIVYRRPFLNFLLHIFLRLFSGKPVKKCREEKKYGFFSLTYRVLCTVKKYKKQCELYRKTLADFLIEPSVKKMRPLDFHKIEEAFTRGREAGCAHIDGILDAVCTLQKDRT